VAALQTVEPTAPPGAQHLYCSGNYNVRGRIIEVVSGRPYAEYIEQRVFTPLQMKHSYTSEQAARQDGLAQGPTPASSLSLRRLYLIVDVVLGMLLLLALWPALRLPRWKRRLREQRPLGWLRRLGVGLRVGLELVVPLALLGGARLLLHMLGAQS
jgi:CubicO group peptidase (beta-lactamase class C family)